MHTVLCNFDAINKPQFLKHLIRRKAFVKTHQIMLCFKKYNIRKHDFIYHYSMKLLVTVKKMSSTKSTSHNRLPVSLRILAKAFVLFYLVKILTMFLT